MLSQIYADIDSNLRRFWKKGRQIPNGENENFFNLNKIQVFIGLGFSNAQLSELLMLGRKN